MLCRLLTWTLVVLTFASAGPVPDDDDFLRAYQLALTDPDYESGVKVAQWTENMNVNPEEMGNYFEGDIMVTKSTARIGIIDPKRRWPNGFIPYKIKGKFNSMQLNLIHEAMKDYETYTCLRLKQRTNEEDYVKIASDDTGCWSDVGRIGGEQTINLQIPVCVTKKGTVIHEIMHAVGFWHEQSRKDRNNYVTINFENIYFEKENNFRIIPPKFANDYNISYNYDSVMHYSADAFSWNGKKTIITKDPKAKIGQRKGFSPSDYQEINKMYEC